MATITLRVPEDDLASIDEVAGAQNRTQFMLAAAREAVARVRRERVDAEVARILAEGADEDRLVSEEWSSVAADAIE
jgi:uncharacterized protein (DUF1778 family)